MRKKIVKVLGSKGFSLIELMITIIIISILATVAYPSYLNAIKKSRRASAQTFLLEIAQNEQQYLLNNRSYTDTLELLNIAIPNNLTAYYEISIVTSNGPPPAFTATARPIENSTQAGDPDLSIDNLGTKIPATAW